MPQIIWTGQAGCLLPILIIFNLLFGKLFIHSTIIWLSIEGLLILLFILQTHFFIRKIGRQFGQNGSGLASDSQSHRSPPGKVVDVEGEVMEETKKLEGRFKPPLHITY